MPGVQSTNRKLGIARASRTLIRDGLACGCCSLRPDPYKRLNLYNSCLSNELPVTHDVVTPALGCRNRNDSPFSLGNRICVRQTGPTPDNTKREGES